MNYTPVIPSQKDLPQKYGARQWRSEPHQNRQFSSKSSGKEGPTGLQSRTAALSGYIHNNKLELTYSILISKVAFK